MAVPAPVVLPEPVAVPAPSIVEAAVEHELEPVIATTAFEQTARVGEPAAVPAARAEEPAQRAVVEALNAAKQGSAADAMEDAGWTVDGTEARVQTELSKTMLPVVMNPEAEKIARNALREFGIMKLTLLPGVSGDGGGAEKKPKAARSGSVQAKALEHPMVQEAQRLFGAEIQTVIDLRER